MSAALGRMANAEVDGLAIEIAESATESIVVYDAAGQIIHWNFASQLLYGWLKLEVLGLSLSDITLGGFGGRDWDALIYQGVWRGTLKRKSPHGEPVSASVRLVAVRDAEGAVAKIIEYGLPANFATVEDLTSEMRADRVAVWTVNASAAEKLIKNQKTSELQDRADLAALLKIKNINRTALRLIGAEATSRDVVGESVIAYWPKKHRLSLIEMIVTLLRDAETGSAVIRQKSNGDTLTVWKSEASDPEAVFISVASSWSEQQMYWELEASEVRFRNLIHNVPIPLWQVDARVMSDVHARLRAEGVTDIQAYLEDNPTLVEFASDSVVVSEVNESAIRLFRSATRSEFLKSVRYLFAATPQAAMRVVVAHFEGRRNHIEEIKVFTFDGQVLDVLLLVTFPQPPETLDTTLIMMVDLTEQRRMEQQLRQVESDFAHAARISALGELVTSIAHEVRQPLSVIVTDADTGLNWLDREEPNIPKVIQLVRRIKENAHRANNVIQRIKDMAVKRDPVRHVVNVNDIVREATTFVKSESEARSISIRLRLGEHISTILGDRVQLQQVVVNLLINSIHAITVRNRTTREIAVETSTAPSNSVLLTVRDSGGGIPDPDFTRIFDGFFSTKSDGMGMGLAICRSIISDHGGTISATNNGDIGAVFQVLFPQAAGQIQTDLAST